jgi:hypothetical protein
MPGTTPGSTLPLPCSGTRVAGLSCDVSQIFGLRTDASTRKGSIKARRVRDCPNSTSAQFSNGNANSLCHQARRHAPRSSSGSRQSTCAKFGHRPAFAGPRQQESMRYSGPFHSRVSTRLGRARLCRASLSRADYGLARQELRPGLMKSWAFEMAHSPGFVYRAPVAFGAPKRGDIE